MKLMVISSPICFKEESRLISQLFENGLEVLHLRKPNADKVMYAKLLDEIALDYRDRVAFHDHHELAADFGTKRLHYPENKRPIWPESSLRIQNINNILSTSIHQVQDLRSVQDFDYAFLSPVFDSLSKTGLKGIIKHDFNLHEQKKAIVSNKTNQVIALGGIGMNNIQRINHMGFDGAALLGWIWKDPLKALNNFKQIQCWIKENT